MTPWASSQGIRPVRPLLVDGESAPYRPETRGCMQIHRIAIGFNMEACQAMGMSRWSVALAIELFALLITAPVFYLSQRFELNIVLSAVGVLLLLWPWRRLWIGVWRAPTPVDWPLFLLFGGMLPVALWAAPEPLRSEYSIPRALILVWNFSLFWVVVTYGSRYSSLFPVVVAGFLGAITGIALLAPLGVNWLFKFALLRPLLERIPSPLVGVFQGAESGFHPNQVAGTLLYALPLMIALSAHWMRSLRRGPVSVRQRWLTAILGSCTLIAGGVLLLTQSRSGLMGLGLALMLLVLWPRRWGRWLLWVGALSLIGALAFYPDAIVDLISDAPPTEALGGLSTLGFRQQVWNAALWGLADFPFTGMGLGTFRELAFLLYPLTIDPNYDIGHAHNFFLQIGLDFGLPGLIAMLAIYFSTAALLVHLWRTGEGVQLAGAPIRVWSLGLLATLAGQTAYSMLDAVAMGARTNFAWWWLLAIALAVGNWCAVVRKAP